MEVKSKVSETVCDSVPPIDAFKVIDALLSRHAPQLQENWNFRYDPVPLSKIILPALSVLERQQPNPGYRQLMSLVALYALGHYSIILQLASVAS